MAGLLHNGQLVGAIQVGLGGEPGAQTVAGVFRGVQANPGGGPLHDQPYRVFVQWFGLQPPMPVDLPEDWPLLQTCRLQPFPIGADRTRLRVGAIRDGDFPAAAFLVGLGAAEGGHQPVFLVRDILDGQSRQLGTPEAARETDQ